MVGGDGSEEKGLITISTLTKDEAVEIRISGCRHRDPGKNPGPRFSIPFFTTKEVGKGTGQGLAISRSVVVDKHGGTVTFETEAGKGTSFIIHLPVSLNE